MVQALSHTYTGGVARLPLGLNRDVRQRCWSLDIFAPRKICTCDPSPPRTDITPGYRVCDPAFVRNAAATGRRRRVTDSSLPLIPG